MDTIKPKRVQAQRSKNRLIIEWEDGHQSEYTFDCLRAHCPCAECRERRESSAEKPAANPLSLPLKDNAATHLVSIEKIGNYAIQLVWGDGHRYGIYAWPYLRQICSCEEHAG